MFASVGPTERLGTAIAAMPPAVRRTLAVVATRDDLPLASGSWRDDGAGCLVANAVACVAPPDERGQARTLDLRMLDAFPQMSSRDLNTLIVAWDEATAQARSDDDLDMRELLRDGLAWAGVPTETPAPSGDGAGADTTPTLATAGSAPSDARRA